MRVHDKENITVDAVFNVRNPPFVQGVSINQPSISWRFPEYAKKDAGAWDKYKALVTISLTIRQRIYGDRFRAIMIALPEMFEHTISSGSDFKSLNRKFPTAMNTEWRVYKESKRYVNVLIEDTHIDQLVLEPDTYRWQFPILVPDRTWPIDTSFRVVLCKQYRPCFWPSLPPEHYLARFPIEGVAKQQDYEDMVENDPNEYFMGAASPRYSMFWRSWRGAFSGPEKRGRGQTPVHIFAAKYGVYAAIISAMPLVSALFLVMNRFSL